MAGQQAAARAARRWNVTSHRTFLVTQKETTVRILVALLTSCLLLESSQLQGQEAGTYYPSRRFTFDLTLRNPRAAQGIMVGEVTPSSALVQVRLTRTRRPVKGDVPGTSGVVEFILQPAGEPDAPPLAQLTYAFAERDFISRVRFDDLDPGTQYVCQTRIGIGNSHMRPGPTASFRTLPGPDNAARIDFVVVTGMNYAKFHGDNRIDRKIETVEPKPEPVSPARRIRRVKQQNWVNGWR